MKKQPLRLVLVDDHEMVLEGLKAVLARFWGRVRVVGQAITTVEAERLVAGLDPDVVVLDVRLRGPLSGLDLCRRLVEEDPGRRVVLLSAYDDEQYLFQALRAGAAGYLLKWIDGEGLVRHLEMAAAGETVIDPTMAGRVVASAARLQAGEFWPGARLGLTQRESEVLGLLVAGLSNKAIAGRLVLGDETVKSHVRAIFRKLEVNDRANAVAVALREGIFR
ncbi:response regulator [Streptomyces caeni]|uniref:Response regulator n=1 Tax=Streptomyces caeni TaxID=2307231 RepID=A0ABW4IYU5_9ACTN